MALPAETPVTIPVDPMVAIEVLVLVHVPPPVLFVSVVVDPAHTLAVPPIAAGDEFTNTVRVSASEPHPFVTVYVIIDDPAPTPVTIPVPDPIVATDGEPLVHTPPVTELVSVVVCPVQTNDAPAIVSTTGTGLTVIALVV